jgi:hypothetical protein
MEDDQEVRWEGDSAGEGRWSGIRMRENITKKALGWYYNDGLMK